MERKVNFTYQSFDISMITISAAATVDQPQKANLLNQLPQIITDKTTRDLHHRKRTVPWLSNMADTQNICIQLFESLTQLISWWSLEVWWKWIAVGHR